MGGGAFAQVAAPGEPTLNTPRMNAGEYTRVKATHVQKIQNYFPDARVTSLIEAPEKADFGDVDILVAYDGCADLVDMAHALGAVGVICHSTCDCTLAVYKDGSAASRPAVVYERARENGAGPVKPSGTVTDEEYAQVDVQVIPAALLAWHTFYASYGDMSSLLGRIVTNLGFTVSNKGFWLRLQELDEAKAGDCPNVADRDGMILLSSAPAPVMRFIGLSPSRYEAGFSTLDAMYEWLGASRLLSPTAIAMNRSSAGERERKQKRTVYTRFFDEWLPAHRRSTVGTIFSDGNDVKQSDEAWRRGVEGQRAALALEAVDAFAKRDEYEAKRRALVRTLDGLAVTRLLKPLIAAHSGRRDKHLAEIVRAFRRFTGVRDDDGRPYVRECAHADADSELYRLLAEDGQGLRDGGAVDAWVRDNWEGIRSLERQRAKGHAAAAAPTGGMEKEGFD